MNRKYLFDVAFVAVLGLATIVVSVAVAADDTKPAAGAAGAVPAASTEMKLPPGWTEEDMKAAMLAGTPGKMQALLTSEAGAWQGKQTMWMSPDAPPMTNEVTSTVTPIMDGRYTRVEVKGDMPGMGPYHGLGIYGFDNVSQKFACTWLDNHSTGMMNGTGELSSDGKQVNWTFTYNCPIAKKPVMMRQTETVGGGSTKTLEMFGVDPKGAGGGKEFKMMRIEMTKR
jgi:hypothetical protein